MPIQNTEVTTLLFINIITRNTGKSP